jgi:hypothetical protein
MQFTSACPSAQVENNQIWKLDLARKNAWSMPWPVAAKDIWLYEITTVPVTCAYWLIMSSWSSLAPVRLLTLMTE